MSSYEFTIVATGLPIEGDEWQDCFFEAGCDDAAVAIQKGVFVLHFDREAASAREAVRSACADVRSAGAVVRRIEPDPLVSMSDIAERARMTRQGVSLYANGFRGEGFPPPAACVGSSHPLWNWSEVAVWLLRAGRIGAPVVELAVAIEQANRPEPPEDASRSRYTRMQFYAEGLRREIVDPRFPTPPSQDAERRNAPFRLRKSTGDRCS